MEIVKLVVLFLGMFLAADFARKQTYSMTAGIESNWMRTLTNSFVWALAASVTGVVISMLLGMAMPAFFTWLIFFTAVDFIFSMIRNR